MPFSKRRYSFLGVEECIGRKLSSSLDQFRRVLFNFFLQENRTRYAEAYFGPIKILSIPKGLQTLHAWTRKNPNKNNRLPNKENCNKNNKVPALHAWTLKYLYKQ